MHVRIKRILLSGSLHSSSLSEVRLPVVVTCTSQHWLELVVVHNVASPVFKVEGASRSYYLLYKNLSFKTDTFRFICVGSVRQPE